MKKLSILIVILAIATLSTFSQDKYSDSEGKYTLDYSVDWKKIPDDIVEKRFKQVQKSIKSDKTINYDAGFQKRLSKGWFTYPYVLINIIETGRLSESDIKKMVGSFENEVKELTEDKSYRYKAIVKKLKMNDTYFEEKHQRLISMMDVKTVNGTLTCLMIMNLTSFGSINLYFYTTPNKWESYYQDFMDFADGLVISNEYNYKNESENKDIKTTKITSENKESQLKNISSEEIPDTNEALYTTFNFLFFTVPLLVFLFIIYRMNIGIEIIKFLNQYKWLVAATICLIFFLMQALIGGVIVFPLILNLILYYPLILYINYLNNYKSKPLESNNIVVLESNKILTLNEPSRQGAIVNVVNDLNTEKKINQNNTDLYKTTEDINVAHTSLNKEIINDIPIYNTDNIQSNNLIDDNINNSESESQNKVEESNDKNKSEISTNVEVSSGNITIEQKCNACGQEVQLNDEEVLNKKYKCPVCFTENLAKAEESIKKNKAYLEIEEELSTGMKILCFIMPCVGVIAAITYVSGGQKKKAGTAILCAFGGFALGMVIRLLSNGR